MTCALALAAPTAAKEPLSHTPDDLAVQAVHNFAACIVDTTPQGAVELIDLDYRSPEYHEKLTRLAHGHSDGRCMSASVMRSDGLLLTGGMAERLLVEKVRADRFPALVAYDPAKPPIAAHNDGEMTSICVTRAEPAHTYAIFQTDPASAEESHAMQAIGPSLLNCVKAGQKMSFNKPGLRAMLALAAYRLTQPAPVASGDAKPMQPSLVQ